MTQGFDLIAEPYDHWYDTPVERAVFDAELKCLCSLCGQRQGRWLEVGVGTGRFASSLGIDEGIDPSSRMLEIAVKRGIRTYEGRAEALPFRDNSFEGILLALAFCFLADPERGLRECWRVLRPKGNLLLGIIPAVYGGAIQMFGRAYRSGPSKNLALRMKAGLQLVWGEQLSWLHPGVVRELENFAFFRDAVRLRWNLRRYFYAGQMARPPALAGEIPNVTADWQWSGVWPVTTPAVMSGAWHLPREKRVAVLFANVSTQTVTASVNCDLQETGLTGAIYTRHKLTSQGESNLSDTPAIIRETVTFPPSSVWAWEISAKE